MSDPRKQDQQSAAPQTEQVRDIPPAPLTPEQEEKVKGGIDMTRDKLAVN